MLKSYRQNIHHSKLPRAGAIGRIVGLYTYPLTDSADYRYSIGIHTCFVKFLDNGEIQRFSGFWFTPDN